MKFQPVLFTAIAFVTGVFMLPDMARAQDQTQQVIQQLNLTSQRSLAKDQQLNEDLIKTLETNFIELKKDASSAYEKEQKEERKSAEQLDLLPVLEALPTAMSQTEILIHDLMDNRYRELNRIPVVNKDHLSGQEKADGMFKVEYLVDSSITTPVDTQAFDIFMRYFCDPQASTERLKDQKWRLSGVKNKGGTISYDLACGKIIASGDAAKLSTRESILGPGNEKKPEGLQVIGLPLRPADLFFAPTTHPTTPGNNKDASNTNKMADVYYGAFAQSLQFLVGRPEGLPSSDINTQAKISKQMLASYPFAMLFAERAGTMGPAAAQSIADLITDKLGSGTQDPVIVEHLENLRSRNSISMAEYMDIVAYQLMTSPGYYERISKELTPAQLRREEVWLTAMQTALNYQRNRWLEIQAALEAVR